MSIEYASPERMKKTTKGWKCGIKTSEFINSFYMYENER